MKIQNTFKWSNKKSSSEFLVQCFLDSFKTLSLQKGSYYGATIIARLDPKVDYNGLKTRALDEINTAICQYKDSLWYIKDCDEDMINIHDQLITQCSGVYSLFLEGNFGEQIEKLIPGIYSLIGIINNDLQKTVGAEILIPYYINKLVENKIINITPEVKSILSFYLPLLEKKVASKTETILFSIEGFEGTPYFDTLLKKAASAYRLFNNVEILAFLSNYSIDGVYERLCDHFKDAKSFKTEAFEYGEIFDIAWQYHLLLCSGLLKKSDLKRLAKKSLPYVIDAGFSDKEGISISKNFILKDADTTAMVYKIIAMSGNILPLDVFSSYVQNYEGKTFFGSYYNEIRPSLGTMADILDAISYSSANDPLRLTYIKIIHENLLYAIRHEENDIDKWHSSKLYFYSNALIAYTNVLMQIEHDESVDPVLYVSMLSLQQNMSEKILKEFQEKQEMLTCEEIGWSVVALSYYVRNGIIVSLFKNKIIKLIYIECEILSKIFNEKYHEDVENLERMWIVKVSYSPINIVNTLIRTSMNISNNFIIP